MKKIFVLVMFSVAAWAVELPGGSTAQLQGTEGTGFLLLVSGSGRQEYVLAVHALLGFQPKANGRGCILSIQTETGVQQTEVANSRDEILAVVKVSRATLTAK